MIEVNPDGILLVFFLPFLVLWLSISLPWLDPQVVGPSDQYRQPQPQREQTGRQSPRTDTQSPPVEITKTAKNVVLFVLMSFFSVLAIVCAVALGMNLVQKFILPKNPYVVQRQWPILLYQLLCQVYALLSLWVYSRIPVTSMRQLWVVLFPPFFQVASIIFARAYFFPQFLNVQKEDFIMTWSWFFLRAKKKKCNRFVRLFSVFFSLSDIITLIALSSFFVTSIPSL